MQSLKTNVSLGIIAGMVAFSCGAEPAARNTIGEFDHAAAAQEIVSNLKLAGFPASSIQVMADYRVVVGKDAVVTRAASREMLGLSSREAPKTGVDYRQHRTTNVVGAAIDTICVDGSDFDGDDDGSENENEKFDNALDNAIASTNAEDLSFSMRRTEGNQDDCDALIVAQTDSGGGGSAGFPANGLPFGEINIGEDLADSANAVVTHVVLHELGHTIGFRHTDFFDRRISCGVERDALGNPLNPDEGAGGVGAVHIPGTPVGAVLNGSVMNACFNNASDGVFTADDSTALQELYGVDEDGGGDDGGGDDGGPNPASCVESNACGASAPAGCFCDSGCVDLGDCCPDGPC